MASGTDETSAGGRATGGSRRALGELAFVGGGKLFNLIALFAVDVLVARVAGTAEYGLYTASLGLVMILEAVFGTPLDQATVRFGVLHRDEPDRSHRFMAMALRLKLLVGAGLVLVALVAGGPLAGRLFSESPRRSLVRVAAAAAMTLLAVRGVAAYFQTQTRFKSYAALDVFLGVSRLLGAWLLMRTGAAIGDAYVGNYAAGAAVGFAASLLWVRRAYLIAPWPDRADRRALLGYLGAAGGVAALGTFTAKSGGLFLTALQSNEAAGVFGAADRVSFMVTLPALYAALVAQPRVIPLARSGRLGRLVRLNVLIVAGLAVAAVPVVIWAAPVAIPAVFGLDYRPAVPVLQVLAAGVLLDMLTMPLMLTFALQLFPRTALVGEVGVTIVYCAAAPLAATAGPMAVAAVAVGIRAAKLVLYAAIFATKIRSVRQ